MKYQLLYPSQKMAASLSEEITEQINHEFYEIPRFFGVQELTSIQK